MEADVVFRKCFAFLFSAGAKDFKMIVLPKFLEKNMKTEKAESKSKKSTSLPSSDEIMSAAEVAAYLKIHRSTVTRWLLDGKISGFKIGTKLLIRKSSVANFLAQNEV